MKNVRIFVVLAILIVVLSACSGLASQPGLDGTSWVLTSLQGQPVSSPPIPTLAFSDGQVSGNASCNHYGGTYERGWGDSIKLGSMMSTLMACADSSAMEREGAYLAVLGQVAKYRLENGQLYLYDGAGQLLAEFKEQ